VLVVAERVCRPVELGLRTRPIPVALPAVPIVPSWHHRHNSDPAHLWLRGEVVDALRPGP
jgi:hypothetical protein